MRESIRVSPNHGVTRDQARELVNGLSVEQLKTVCTEIGFPADYRTRTKKALIEHIANSSVGFLLDSYAINPRWGR
jgi:hypothetical protein